jgi:hypothetical protein
MEIPLNISQNMTLSRAKFFLRAGSISMTFGTLFAGLLNMVSSTPLSVLLGVLAVLLLAPGLLVLLTGCITFCFKEHSRQLMLTGAVASGVSLLLIPGVAALAHFDPNIHDWTGPLFFLWILSSVIGPIILLAGLARYLLQARRTGPK